MVLSDIIPFGDFYCKAEAERIVNENVKRRKMRNKMQRLIELIPKKKSLLLAQKELKCRDLEDVDELRRAKFVACNNQQAA